MSGPRAAILAVDGGNSKTDLALVAADGALLAAARGPTVSHQAVGLAVGMAALEALAAAACTAARLDPAARPVAELGVYCLAGADLPRDVRLLTAALGERALARRSIVLNDSLAALRAGAPRGWGVVVICGQGVNCAGRAPDGRSFRFPALGGISGDWGGGGAIGTAVLAAAIRARDGRGPRTVLERLVPAHFGLARPLSVTYRLYGGEIADDRLPELAPLAFAAAADGDAVARGIVDRLADELAAMATVALRRLRLVRRDVDVVLAGGVFRTDEPGFYRRLSERIGRVAPRARLARLAAAPVLGAALIGLDDRTAGGPIVPEVEARLRAALSRWRPDEAGR